MPKKKLTFESAVNRLSEIVEAMESDETALSKSVLLYKEGVGLSVICRKELDDAETTVKILSKKLNGEIETSSFDEDYYDGE